jgi:TRAP-type transport system periplasmic protein
MYTRRQVAIHVMALSALLAGGGSVARAQSRTLRFSTIDPAGAGHIAGVLEPFRQAVETRSGGRLTVDLRLFEAGVQPATFFSAVEHGDVELAQTVQGYSPGHFPRSSVVELPLLLDSAAIGGKVLTTLFQEGLLNPEYDSVKVLALNAMPPATIFTTGRKITSAKDFRGLRIRIANATAGRAMALLGAIPIGVPFSDIGEALTNGTVDAIMFYMDSTRVVSVSGGKMLTDLLSVAVDVHFGSTALMLVMNRASWDGLSEDLRAVVDAAGHDFAANDGRVRDATEAVARAKFQADPRYTCIEFTPEQTGELRRVIQPAYDDWKATMNKSGIDGQRLLSRANELIKQFSVASN